MSKRKAVLISSFGYLERLKPISEVLKEAGYSVTIINSDFDHINKSKIIEKDLECEYISVFSYKRNLSLRRIISHNQFARKIKKRVYEIKPDLIYALMPTNKTGYVCAKYKQKKSNIRLIVDIIDLWPESMPVEGFEKTWIGKKWARYRNEAINIADFVFTECKMYQDILKDFIKEDRAEVLYLYKDCTENLKKKIIDINARRKEIRAELCNDKKVINLCYLGSINFIIDIEKIIKVCQTLLKKYYVKMHIIGDGETRENFIEELKKIKCEYVYYGKIYDDEEKAKIISNCDFGINIMKDTVKVGLTTKSIDYFMFGIGIINNIKGDTWNLLESNSLGVNYLSVDDSFLEEIDRYLNNDNNIGEIYKNNFTRDAFIRRLKSGLIIEE